MSFEGKKFSEISLSSNLAILSTSFFLCIIISADWDEIDTTRQKVKTGSVVESYRGGGREGGCLEGYPEVFPTANFPTANFPTQFFRRQIFRNIFSDGKFSDSYIF